MQKQALMQPMPLSSPPVQSAMLRLLAVFRSATTRPELLEPALTQMTTIMASSHAGVLLLPNLLHRESILSYQHGAIIADDVAPLYTSLNERLGTGQIALEFDDVAAVSLPAAALQIAETHQLRSILALPMIVGQRSVGMLVFADTLPRAWDTDTLFWGQLLATQLAQAIANVELTEWAARQDEEVATLNDIAATVTSTLDPREVYHLVVKKINEYFRVEAGSLLLLDQQTRELVFVMTLEAGEEKLKDVRVPPGRGLVSEALRTRQPVIVADAQNDPRFYKKVSEDVGFATQSALCVPMLVQGREIGVIQLLNKLEGAFTDEDADRLSAMANTIAVAIDNARLFQEVSQNRDQLQAILNSTQDGILTIDNADTVVTANPMLERMFGLPWQQLVGRSGTQILEQIKRQTRPSITDGRTPSSTTSELEIRKPQAGFVRRVVLPVYSSEREEIGQLIVFHDINKERELARLRDDYTGMLIHDLRSPLTGIMNGLTMVRREFAGPINPQQRELLDIANKSSQAMLSLINTLLDIGKMEVGQIHINYEPCSVYEIVEQAIERVIASARSVNIEIVRDVAIGLPTIEADQDKLVRVLQNLLDNAVKFTPPNGTVRIDVRQLDADSAILWKVIDQGPGIPEEYQDRIFEKFIQVKNQRVKGTGLGLAFAKLTTQAHNGRIWVESVEGDGSTFAFTTPYKPIQ